MHIRSAVPADANAMLKIYAPIVRTTSISFEIEPPTLEEFEHRIEKYAQGWTWLVAEENGQLLGYAYGSSHRERLAYKWSTETSAYVHEGSRRRGVGKLLYEALLPALATKGYCNAYAGIALPNAPSISLHHSVGFVSIGQFPAVGRKFGRWHDVGWFHRKLRAEPISEA